MAVHERRPSGDARPRSTGRDVLRSDPTDYPIITGTIIVGIYLVMFRNDVLPRRFISDSANIAAILDRRLILDDSFMNVARIYQSLGLGGHEIVAGMIQFLIAVLIIVKVVKDCRSSMTSSMEIIAGIAIILSAVYLGGYSKDAVLAPIAWVACLSPRRKGAVFALVIMIAVYGVFFRTYWLAVLGMYGAAAFVIRRKVSGVRWLGTTIILAVGSAVVITMITKEPASIYRATINQYRQGDSDASTLITPVFNLSEPLSSFINAPVTALALMIPVPLFLTMQAYYLIIASSICYLWVTFVGSLSRLKRRIGAVSCRREAALLSAFVAVQSVFEPDYGSALKHLTPLLPLLISVVLRTHDAETEQTRLGMAGNGMHEDSIQSGQEASVGRLAVNHEITVVP